MRKTKVPKPKKGKNTIFIVDDHPLMCEGLTRLLNHEADLMVCGQSHTAHEALKRIPELEPDIVIVDITLTDGNGIDLIKDMKRRSIPSKVLVLSMHDENLYAERALQAGAKGYIMKQEVSREVLKAIHKILDGEIYLSDKMGARMLHKIADAKTVTQALSAEILSDRELQVFQLIGQGHSTRQIADKLCVSVKTVESYRAHIKLKMNLENAHELTQHAVHWVESNHLN
jgi:DNA-binding NarL/FixJ family response regulator